MRQPAEKSVFLAMLLAVAEIANAMNASPQNLVVDQCTRRATTVVSGLRGVAQPEVAACPACEETTTITLKQNGNAMIHWITTEDGMYMQ